MRWASIDAAQNVSGVAMWCGTRLLCTEIVKGLAADDWGRSLTGCAGIVLEDGYVGPNRRTGLALAYARGRIVTIAELWCDAECWGMLSASKWRGEIGITPGSRAQVKAQARAMCRWLRHDPATRPAAGGRWDSCYLDVMTGRETDDECEAVLIGLAYQAIAERASR